MYRDTKQLLSNTKFYEGYARFIDSENRYESWDEAVDRVMDMHKQFYKDKLNDELNQYISVATVAYKEKRVLGAQRALQFGGKQLLSHMMRIYNCTSSYADRPEFFGELLYILLCGAGAGFSVQKHHIGRLPQITQRNKQPKTHVVDDSIEGWATALDVLMSSYFVGGGKHPEYEGRKVYFDLNKIRPKNSEISGGFKAPGPEPLRLALDRIEYILQGSVLNSKQPISLKPIQVYDICMHTADAVLAGGVRRSATLCMFSADDNDMLNAKTGNWFTDNPQRARSNNSVVIVRDKIKADEFHKLMLSIKQFGEPGFVFVDSTEHTFNPCVTGDTVIKVKDHDITLNGEIIAMGSEYTLTIKQLTELYEKTGILPNTISYNEKTGKKEYKQIMWAGQTKKSATLIKVTDQKTGKSIKLTPDHKVWTDNRGYVEAKDLLEDDILNLN